MASTHEVEPWAPIDELLAEADASDFFVGQGMDHQAAVLDSSKLHARRLEVLALLGFVGSLNVIPEPPHIVGLNLNLSNSIYF